MPKFDVNGIEFISTKHGLSTCLVPVLMDIETANNHAEDVKDLITWMTSCQVWFNGSELAARDIRKVRLKTACYDYI